MAELPNVEDTTDAILSVIAEYKIRSGETAPLMGIQTKLLEKGYRTDDLNIALDHMFEMGLLEAARKGFVMLTETGFKKMP